MKVYVDELPKSCAECEWFTPNHSSKDGRNFCLLARMPFYNTEEERQTTRGQYKDSLSDFDCPLQSLSDHTKQVRKEVFDTIQSDLLDFSHSYWRVFKQNGKQYMTDDDIIECLDEISKKIQGE